tara:strand:- start:711 stop:926 length:216 start_codon:yes stop_codon:yes gene_type:complete
MWRLEHVAGNRRTKSLEVTKTCGPEAIPSFTMGRLNDFVQPDLRYGRATGTRKKPPRNHVRSGQFGDVSEA